MGSQWLKGILEIAADTCGYSNMDRCGLAPMREAVLFQDSSRGEQPCVYGSLTLAERPALLGIGQDRLAKVENQMRGDRPLFSNSVRSISRRQLN